jgi:cytochrome c-type biogenesis protein CcmH
MFYVIAGLLVLIAVLVTLLPLVRSRPNSAERNKQTLSTRAANLDAFRTQKRELDAERANGLITEAEHAAAAEELSARLNNELAADEGGASMTTDATGKPKWILGAALSAFVATTAVAGYAMWGTPDHSAQRAAASQPAGTPTAHMENGEAPIPDKQILSLVEQLAKKMEENPNDPKGWILLARSQNALGQFGLAVKAFDRAAALNPGDAQVLADYADALAMTQEGKLDGKPMELVSRALKVDPANMKALALAGTAEMRAGNKPASLKHWEKLQTLVPKDSEDYTQIAAIINEIKTGKPAFAQSPQAPQTPQAPPAATSAPTQVAANNAPANAPVSSAPPRAGASQANAPASAGKTVSGTITIAPQLISKVSNNDTLFIFARAVNGPKMPLAVIRIPVPSKWPHTYELTEAMSMAPGVSLASFPEVTVEARISKGGNAQLQPGDLTGGSAPVKPPAKGVAVTISSVAP